MDAINTVLNRLYRKNTYTITHLSSTKTFDELTDKEKSEVKRMEKKDAEVRAHEQAHKRAAGPLARGGINYKYVLGPNGKSYAVSGNICNKKHP